MQELAEREEQGQEPDPAEVQPEDGVEGERPRLEARETEGELAGEAEGARVDVPEPGPASSDREDEEEHQVVGGDGDVAHARDEEAPREEAREGGEEDRAQPVARAEQRLDPGRDRIDEEPGVADQDDEQRRVEEPAEKPGPPVRPEQGLEEDSLPDHPQRHPAPGRGGGGSGIGRGTGARSHTAVFHARPATATAAAVQSHPAISFPASPIALPDYARSWRQHGPPGSAGFRPAGRRCAIVLAGRKPALPEGQRSREARGTGRRIVRRQVAFDHSRVRRRTPRGAPSPARRPVRCSRSALAVPHSGKPGARGRPERAGRGIGCCPCRARGDGRSRG